MVPPAPNYLHTCRASFRAVSEQLYQRPFDLEGIENDVKQHLRDGNLTYEALSFFVAKDRWWFEKFWVFPPEDKIMPGLAQVPIGSSQARVDRVLIENLLDIFRSIELVSIVLRFVRPEAYGIISPPVERVLDVRRGSDAVETYCNYLDNLETIRSQYGFTRIADVDMALWVLHERCFGEFRDESIRAQFQSDGFMLRLRAHNAVAHLLEGRSYGDIADAVVAFDERLAAVLACYTFELALRKFVRRLGVSQADASRPLLQLIQIVPESARAPRARRSTWRELNSLRNALFHSGALPSKRDLIALIGEVRQLERDVL